MNFSRSRSLVGSGFHVHHRRRSGLHHSAAVLALIVLASGTVACSDDSESSSGDSSTTSIIIDSAAIEEALGIPADAPEPTDAIADCISAATVLASMNATTATGGSIPAPEDLDAQIETVRSTFGADLQPSFDTLVETYRKSAGATQESVYEMVSATDYIAADEQVTKFLQDTCG